MAILLRIPIALACLAASLAAGASPVLASWMTPPPPYRAKDFAIVKHEGEFHLFYIRNDPNLPFDSTEVDFGHAVSRDLYIWQQMPPVLAVRDSGWDADHVWAPSIVKRDSLFYLFYTGVTDQPAGPRLWQRTGLAVSTDLYNWERLDAPVLTCETTPWVWCDSLSAATAFRDPCVVPDLVQPGRWLMVYSAFPDSDPTSMVAGIATSDGDFTSWDDHSPLWISYRTTTGNGLVESPNLFERDSLYYLFFTTSHLQHIHYAVTPDPAGDPSMWSYRGSVGGMLGVDASSWFASEHLRDGLLDYFAFVNGDRIDVRQMVWGTGGTFTLQQPDVFHIFGLHWSADSAGTGDTLSLTIESANGFGRLFPYQIVAVAPDGSETVIEHSDLGVSPAPTIWNSPASWTWTITSLPDTVSGGVLPTLVVRTVDQTCSSPPLALIPPPPPPPYKPPGGYRDPRVLQPGDEPPHLKIVEFGAGRSVRLELAAATEARIEIFDLNGRRVRVLADRKFERGVHELAWDGLGHGGHRMPRGLYFARLSANGQRAATARIILN